MSNNYETLQIEDIWQSFYLSSLAKVLIIVIKLLAKASSCSTGSFFMSFAYPASTPSTVSLSAAILTAVQ